jgi:hypothetical protein
MAVLSPSLGVNTAVTSSGGITLLAVRTAAANCSIQPYGFSITKLYVVICLSVIPPESHYVPEY